eukprot:1159368-Pelagomonas_calceolata.AAC.3
MKCLPNWAAMLRFTAALATSSHWKRSPQTLSADSTRPVLKTYLISFQAPSAAWSCSTRPIKRGLSEPQNSWRTGAVSLSSTLVILVHKKDDVTGLSLEPVWSSSSSSSSSSTRVLMRVLVTNDAGWLPHHLLLAEQSQAPPGPAWPPGAYSPGQAAGTSQAAGKPPQRQRAEQPPPATTMEGVAIDATAKQWQCVSWQRVEQPPPAKTMDGAHG